MLLCGSMCPDMFCNFNLVKDPKIAYNSTITEKITTYQEFLAFRPYLMWVALNLKAIKFYQIKLANSYWKWSYVLDTIGKFLKLYVFQICL